MPALGTGDGYIAEGTGGLANVKPEARLDEFTKAGSSNLGSIGATSIFSPQLCAAGGSEGLALYAAPGARGGQIVTVYGVGGFTVWAIVPSPWNSYAPTFPRGGPRARWDRSRRRGLPRRFTRTGFLRHGFLHGERPLKFFPPDATPSVNSCGYLSANLSIPIYISQAGASTSFDFTITPATADDAGRPLGSLAFDTDFHWDAGTQKAGWIALPKNLNADAHGWEMQESGYRYKRCSRM